MHGAWLTTHLNYTNLIDLELISSLGNQGIPILPTLIQVVKKIIFTLQGSIITWNWNANVEPWILITNVNESSKTSNNEFEKCCP